MPSAKRAVEGKAVVRSERPFQYDVVKNKIRIKAYIGKEDVVSVPEKIEEKQSTKFGRGHLRIVM